MDLSSLKVGIVGGGKMTQAILKGIFASGLVKPSQVMASAKTEATLLKWKEMGANASPDNCRVVQESDVIFLGVKPYMLKDILDEIKVVVTDKKLLVSVIAGATLCFMEENLPKGSRVIRSIPNTPAAVQSGVIVYTRGKNCCKSDSELIQALLETTGYAKEVPESQIDAVSCVAGSAVAFYFAIIDAAADGGVKIGLQRQMAIEMAARTMIGAGKMVLETGRHPCALKDDVCSPGGSTIVGIGQLEASGVRGAVIKAIDATLNQVKSMAPK